jgi:hypothetical protein
VDVLACVLAQPNLHSEVDAASLEEPGVQRFVRAVAELVGRGVTDRETVIKDLFTGCSEDPRAATVLAQAIDRADRMREPRMTLEAAQHCRGRYLAREAARRVRVDLEQARLRGDAVEVERLTCLYYAKLQERLKTLSPRG